MSGALSCVTRSHSATLGSERRSAQRGEAVSDDIGDVLDARQSTVRARPQCGTQVDLGNVFSPVGCLRPTVFGFLLLLRESSRHSPCACNGDLPQDAPHLLRHELDDVSREWFMKCTGERKELKNVHKGRGS